MDTKKNRTEAQTTKIHPEDESEENNRKLIYFMIANDETMKKIEDGYVFGIKACNLGEISPLIEHKSNDIFIFDLKEPVQVGDIALIQDNKGGRLDIVTESDKDTAKLINHIERSQ